jgi:RNA polymerase sigma-70 factor (sigma-E family)
MVRLAYALSGDPGHAEAIAQAAFARAYASWGRVQRAGDPDAYVRRIVINANRSRFRRRRVTEELHADLPERLAGQQLGPQDEPGADHGALLAALARLGPRQRAVVVLRYWLDLSEAETAATLNCSVGTVKSQASRALATLRATPALRAAVTALDRAADGSGAAPAAGDQPADIVEKGGRW